MQFLYSKAVMRALTMYEIEQKQLSLSSHYREELFGDFLPADIPQLPDIYLDLPQSVRMRMEGKLANFLKREEEEEEQKKNQNNNNTKLAKLTQLATSSGNTNTRLPKLPQGKSNKNSNNNNQQVALKSNKNNNSKLPTIVIQKRTFITAKSSR